MSTYPQSNFSGYSVGVATRAQAEPLIRSHYLHRWPGVVVLTLGMWTGAFIIGTIVFALPPRETMLRYKVALVWELARLYILDSAPFNSETWFMARAIRHVKQNHREVGALVSYADPSAGHQGTIYKAANWRADGRTDQERKTPRFDYRVAGKMYSRCAHVPDGAQVVRVPRVSKFRFVYFFDAVKSKGVKTA